MVLIILVMLIIVIMICIDCRETFSESGARPQEPKILPIHFAIPESMFRDPQLGQKKYKFSPMIPGDRDTYKYKTEDEYYRQYQESKFGITMTKAGHDCLRHYEIIAAGAIPYYIDPQNTPPSQITQMAREDRIHTLPNGLGRIPKTTMHRFPREIVTRAMAGDDYAHCLGELQKYAKKYLTTKSLAMYFLGEIGYVPNTKILFVSQPHPKAKTDYQRDCLAIGLLEYLPVGMVDFYEDLPWLFDDYLGCRDNYGSGYSVCGKVPHRLHRIVGKSDILGRLGAGMYGTIVVATSSNMPQIDVEIGNVLGTLGANNIKMVHVMGNDGKYDRDMVLRLLGEFYPKYHKKFQYVFVRELYSKEELG